jgi:hypothetical protein
MATQLVAKAEVCQANKYQIEVYNVLYKQSTKMCV